MRKIVARIPVGRTVVEQEVELYTKQEAKIILKNTGWDVDVDIFDAEVTNKRIGWLASFGNGEGIYIEA